MITMKEEKTTSCNSASNRVVQPGIMHPKSYYIKAL